MASISCAVVIRSFNSFLKHLNNIFFISSLAPQLIFPLIKLFAIQVQVRFLSGVSPMSISYKIMPMLQISLLALYIVYLYDSGLIQAGEPTLYDICGFFVSPRNQQNPKSAILAPVRVRKMLADLISLCTIFFYQILWQPSATSLMIWSASHYISFTFFLMYCCRSPFQQYSVIMQTLFLVMRIQMVLSIFLWLSARSALISLLSRYFQTQFSILLSSSTLMAMVSLLSSFTPLQTVELKPEPIKSLGSYMQFFIFFTSFCQSVSRVGFQLLGMLFINVFFKYILYIYQLYNTFVNLLLCKFDFKLRVQSFKYFQSKLYKLIN